MPTFRAEVDGAEIIIDSSALTGKETVTYDGQVVSEKTSYLYLTVHSFDVVTNGVRDVYEVNVIAGLGKQGFVIRKNGIVVAHEP